MRIRGVLGCLVAATLAPSAVGAEELPSPLSLPALLDAVRTRSPLLTEARHMARASSARPRAQGQPDDPMLSVDWWQQPVDFRDVPIMISARQPLPWLDKLAARRQLAERQAIVVHEQLADVALRLDGEVVRTFFELVLADELLAINERMHHLLEAMATTAEARYRAGRTTQAEVLKAQSELLTLDNDRLDLQRGREEAVARLNSLLDRPSEAPLPPLAVEHPTGVPMTLAQAMARGLEQRPELRVGAASIAEAETRVRVARFENRPELAISAGYMINVRGTDSFTVGLSTTLPIFSSRRRSAMVESEEAEVRARRAAVQAARRRIEQEIRVAFLRIDAAERHERLHSDRLIPLAELALKAAEAAYQNDRIGFLAVLDAARMLREHHLNHAQYHVEYQRRLVELELAVGSFAARDASSRSTRATREEVSP